MSQRFEGHSLDEALGNAARGLGVERYQLSYHVVLEKRGFLGGLKRVVIEADVDRSAQRPPEAAAPAADTAPEYAPAPPRPHARMGEPRERGGREAGGRGRSRGGRGGRERGGRERGGRERGRRDSRPRGGERDESRPFRDDRGGPVSVAPEQGPESPLATDIREWCERMFELAGLEVDVRTEETDAEVRVKLYGRDARMLTAKNGEVLDAAQILANKTFGGRKTEKPIELDTEEFKERRALELEQQARELADVVRRDGREQLLPAMSPVERRIVHLALQNDEGVETVSRGDGFYKRVAIVPRRSDEERANS